MIAPIRFSLDSKYFGDYQEGNDSTQRIFGCNTHIHTPHFSQIQSGDDNEKEIVDDTVMFLYCVVACAGAKRLFAQLDSDHDGKITCTQFTDLLRLETALYADFPHEEAKEETDSPANNGRFAVLSSSKDSINLFAPFLRYIEASALTITITHLFACLLASFIR